MNNYSPEANDEDDFNETGSNESIDIDSFIDDLKRKVAKYDECRLKKLCPINHNNNQRVNTYQRTRSQRLWSMKVNNEYIDSTIITNNDNGGNHHEENVHLPLLLIVYGTNLLNSLRFLGYSNNEMMIRQYQIDTSSGAILTELINFAYKNYANLNQDNCLEIARFCHKYHIEPLLNYCFDYFRMNNDNLLNIIEGFKMSINNSNDNGYRHYFQDIITTNFSEIVERFRSNLLEIDDRIFDVLKSQELAVINEEQIWSIIHDWISHDQCNRLKYLDYSITNVLRFGRLKDDFIALNVFNCILFKQLDINLQRRLIDWIDSVNRNTITIKDGYGLRYSKQSLYYRPRQTKQLLLVGGGWVEGSTTNSFELYDYQTNLWLKCPLRLHEKISYFGLEIMNDVIYVYGGSNGSDVFKNLHAFDLNDQHHQQWTRKCSMNEFRCYLSSVCFDGHLYAIGGFNRQTRVRSCERYDPSTDSWQSIAELNYGRSDASATVFDGKIFIAGGINDSGIEHSAEIYYPHSNQWLLIRSMASPRTSFSIAAFQGKIWALGGNDGIKRSAAVECYDPKSNTWTTIDDMVIKRSTFRAAILNGHLYVIGGYNSQSPVCDVEKFVPNLGWLRVKPLRHDRSGHSVLVISNKYDFLKI